MRKSPGPHIDLRGFFLCFACQPLTIVVIGGYVTATLLTLLVLPTIFPWFEPKKDRRSKPEPRRRPHADQEA
jgi:hypothetical protein